MHAADIDSALLEGAPRGREMVTVERRLRVRQAVATAIFYSDGGVADERDAVLVIGPSGSILGIMPHTVWTERREAVWHVSSRALGVHWDGVDSLEDWLENRCRSCWQAIYENEPHTIDCPIQPGSPCTTCHGSGRIEAGPLGLRPPTQTCRECRGSGTVGD